MTRKRKTAFPLRNAVFQVKKSHRAFDKMTKAIGLLYLVLEGKVKILSLCTFDLYI